MCGFNFDMSGTYRTFLLALDLADSYKQFIEFEESLPDDFRKLPILNEPKYQESFFRTMMELPMPARLALFAYLDGRLNESTTWFVQHLKEHPADLLILEKRMSGCGDAEHAKKYLTEWGGHGGIKAFVQNYGRD